MKQIYALLAIMLFAGLQHQAYAQSQGEILVQNKGLGFAYYHKGREISKSELLYVLDTHPEANKQLKTGHRNNMPAKLLSYAGGVMLAYPIAAHMTGAQPSWTMAGIGAGMMVLSLPFSGARMKREQDAVYRYNTGVRQASNQGHNLRVDYEVTGASVKLSF